MTTAVFDYKAIRERMQTNPFGLKPDEAVPAHYCTRTEIYNGPCPYTCEELHLDAMRTTPCNDFTGEGP